MGSASEVTLCPGPAKHMGSERQETEQQEDKNDVPQREIKRLPLGERHTFLRRDPIRRK